MSLLKVSIITVCFNSEETIAQTIKSVHDQSWGAIEHIIVDGGSSDKTIDLIHSTSNRVYKIISESDFGIYDAMNKGLKLATGEIVGFLNSDDYFSDARVLQKIVENIVKTGSDGCYGDVAYFSKNSSASVIRTWRAGAGNLQSMCLGWMPPHPTFYIKRKIYESIEPFSLHYSLASDFEMAIRVLKIPTLKLTYIPEILVMMRVGGASNRSVKNVLLGNIESYRAAKIHGLDINIFFPLIKILKKLPQFNFINNLFSRKP